ncbi:MAG: signal peptidase II [Gemmatimonadaceae bacterium]|nr:signal peptidase II [Gemmatimonadaceae bacterium]
MSIDIESCMVRKSNIYYPLAAVWLIADFLTKRWVFGYLTEHGGSQQIFGDYLRLTLALNRGMAFGFSFGEWSRLILICFVLITIALIYHLYRQTSDSETTQAVALGLITGGALGNLVDRLTSARGVVDFIDVGIGTHRFWLFNVADAGVSIGGALLVLTLWTASNRHKEMDGQRENPQT